MAQTQVDALVRLEKAVAETIEDMSSEGEPIPDPLSERSFCGKFNLRVGEALHRRPAIEAAEEKLSINRLIVRRVNSASQRQTPDAAASRTRTLCGPSLMFLGRGSGSGSTNTEVHSLNNPMPGA